MGKPASPYVKASIKIRALPSEGVWKPLLELAGVADFIANTKPNEFTTFCAKHVTNTGWGDYDLVAYIAGGKHQAGVLLEGGNIRTRTGTKYRFFIPDVVRARWPIHVCGHQGCNKPQFVGTKYGLCPDHENHAEEILNHQYAQHNNPIGNRERAQRAFQSWRKSLEERD